MGFKGYFNVFLLLGRKLGEKVACHVMVRAIVGKSSNSFPEKQPMGQQ